MPRDITINKYEDTIQMYSRAELINLGCTNQQAIQIFRLLDADRDRLPKQWDKVLHNEFNTPDIEEYTLDGLVKHKRQR